MSAGNSGLNMIAATNFAALTDPDQIGPSLIALKVLLYNMLRLFDRPDKFVCHFSDTGA
jgi:hypothetical protein